MCCYGDETHLSDCSVSVGVGIMPYIEKSYKKYLQLMTLLLVIVKARVICQNIYQLLQDPIEQWKGLATLLFKVLY